MARYFFSIRCQGRLLPDREGIYLSDTSTLDDCATHLAQRLRNDLGLPKSFLDGCSVEVSDAAGTLLKSISISNA